jgi:FG-GAP-like repeat
MTPNDMAGTVSVLLGKGDGTLLPRRDYATERHPASVAIGDLEGDGKPDVVTAGLRSESEADSAISVLFNRGDGTFRPRRDHRFEGGSFAIGDLSGDGRPDLVTTSTRGVSALLNRGDGRFNVGPEYSTGGESAEVEMGELSGDRRLDLAVANTTVLHNDAPSDLSVLINTPGLSSAGRVSLRRTLRRLRSCPASGSSGKTASQRVLRSRTSRPMEGASPSS